MRPESGFTRPRATFSTVVLPLPATPNTIRVSPGCSSNETRSSAGASPKCRLTSSNRRTASDSISRKIHKDLTDEIGHDKNPDGGDYHGFGGGAADAFRTAGGPHPIEAAHQRHNDRERKRFDEPLHDVVVFQDLPRRSPE